MSASRATSRPIAIKAVDSSAIPSPTRFVGPSLCGELDVAAVPHMHQVLKVAILESRNSRVHVDLSEVTFIDSSGVGALVANRNLARSMNRDLVLVAPSKPVAEVLAITALDTWFPIIDAI